jgi:hypothetical protein
MSPADDVRRGARDRIEKNGEPASYQSARSGEPIATTVVLQKDVERYVAGGGETIAVERVNLAWVLVEDVPRSEHGDTITMGEQAYKVERQDSDNGFERSLIVLQE